MLVAPDTVTSRAVAVVRVGSSRYVVSDSAVTGGEFIVRFIFDTTLSGKALRRYGGYKRRASSSCGCEGHGAFVATCSQVIRGEGEPTPSPALSV